jgi:predicted enzyme related to lactoylglutathione lyase
MAKVLGIGGFFFKARDPKALTAWYAARLHFEVQPWGGAKLTQPGTAVWTPFPADTKYFEPSDKPYMVNFRVDDLAELLAELRAAGENVLDRQSDDEYGKFGYVVDPEGNIVELWQAPPEKAAGA